jgi:glycosyltransferase involved in cell wall biosynthesis
MAQAASTHWRQLLQEDDPEMLLCLTKFARDRLVDAGAPADRVLVKPNSVSSGEPLPWKKRRGAVYVGRLSREKGIEELVDAWPQSGPDLRVVGDGPLMHSLLRSTRTGNVSFAGQADVSTVRSELRSARVLLLPSLWFEGLPLVVLEALAEGTPIVCFRLGSMATIEGVNSESRVSSGDFGALVDRALAVCSMEAPTWKALSDAGLLAHRRCFDDTSSLAGLELAYETAIERALGSSSGPHNG